MIRCLIVFEIFLVALLGVRWLDDGIVPAFAPVNGVAERLSPMEVRSPPVPKPRSAEAAPRPTTTAQRRRGIPAAAPAVRTADEPAWYPGRAPDPSDEAKPRWLASMAGGFQRLPGDGFENQSTSPLPKACAVDPDTWIFDEGRQGFLHCGRNTSAP